MFKRIDITQAKNAAKVLVIQIPAYRIEAEYINFYEIPPLKDTVETLQTCGETFYGYYENGELCGAVSFKMGQGVMDIHRLMVHPKHFRQGIALKLLDFVLSAEKSVHTVIVSTGSKNTPAVIFYENYGFSKLGEFETAEHLSITSLKKTIGKDVCSLLHL